MEDNLVEKYAEVITREDVRDLFRYMEKQRSLAEVAMLAGLERKTVYDWSKSKYLKISTKRKVLHAAFELIPEETFTLLCKRLSDSLAEVLQIQIATIYESVINSTDRLEFLDLAKKFDEIKSEYAGLIATRLYREVAETASRIIEHGKTLGADWLPKPLGVLEENHLTRELPGLVRALFDAPNEKRALEVAQFYGFTEQFGKKLFNVLRTVPLELSESSSVQFSVSEGATLVQQVSPALQRRLKESAGSIIEMPSLKGESIIENESQFWTLPNEPIAIGQTVPPSGTIASDVR